MAGRGKTYTNDTTVQTEALALGVHHVAVIHVRRRSHESGFVEVGIELLSLAIHLLAGVEALQTVLLECAQESLLGHLETVDEVEQILVGIAALGSELLRGHGQQCAVEVVNALQQVLGEALNGKVAGTVHVALSALLQVTELGDGAKVFVLSVVSMCNQGYDSKS